MIGRACDVGESIILSMIQNNSKFKFHDLINVTWTFAIVPPDQPSTKHNETIKAVRAETDDEQSGLKTNSGSRNQLCKSFLAWMRVSI